MPSWVWLWLGGALGLLGALLVCWLASFLVKRFITLVIGFVKSKFGSVPRAKDVESDGEENQIHQFWGEEPGPSPASIFIAKCCTK